MKKGSEEIERRRKNCFDKRFERIKTFERLNKIEVKNI